MANLIETTFSALSDHTRRSVVESLLRGPKRSGELASGCSVSAPVMSRHLRVLRASGLVEVVTLDERDARLRVYRLCPEPFACLKDWVDHATAFWAAQLTSFKAHVERNASKTYVRKKGAKT